MSKRSKRSGGGRGFGKQEMLMESQALVGFAVTVTAFQRAAQKLAALEPSKTAQEWEQCLIKEATEEVLGSESVELVEGTVDLEEGWDTDD